MRGEEIEEAQRVIAGLLTEVEHGSLEAPPKLVRLLQATQRALAEQVPEAERAASNEDDRSV